MTPEATDQYIDAVILKTLNEKPGLSGEDLCRYAISVGLEDCHVNAVNVNHQCALEVLMVKTLSPENIFRRCDVLLEDGDIRFDDEEDAWFSVPEETQVASKDAWADVFVDTILQEAVEGGLDLTDKKQRETIVMGLMDAIQFLDNECEWPEDLRR